MTPTFGFQVRAVVWNCMMYFRSSSRALMYDLIHSTWVLSLRTEARAGISPALSDRERAFSEATHVSLNSLMTRFP